MEKDFKAKIQNQLKKQGCVIIQNVAGAGVPTGFPDTTIISPFGKVYFVEWKKTTNAKKQPLQEAQIARLRKMGHSASFVYPENVGEWLEDYQSDELSSAEWFGKTKTISD